MVFSSVTFLFFFLPITLVIYFFLWNTKAKNAFLLIVSLIFYVVGEKAYSVLLIVVIVMNYLFGIWMARSGTRRRLVLVLAVAGNLLIMVFFKAGNFIVGNVNALLGLFGYPSLNIPPIHLPAGISFFIFAIMSYVIDLYRGNIEVQKNPFSLGLYLSVFPKLMQGPIERYGDIAGQVRERRVSLDGFVCGLKRFIVGLAKKVLVANTLGVPVAKIFSTPTGELTAGVAWFGIASFILQLYFDFSGYTDMAIGLGRMFGFNFRENFNYPYISRSLREFWRRWHITLTSWFRDYLYIPMGGSRVSRWRGYYNIVFVFLLTGLWHGASWTYIVWGLFNGVILVLERASNNITEKMWSPIGNIYFLVIFMVSLVFFRSETVSYSWGYLGAMFGFSRPVVAQYTALQFLSHNDVLTAFLAAAVGSRPVVPFIRSWIERRMGGLEGQGQKALNLAFSAIQVFSLTALLIVSSMSLASDTYNPFIYQQF
jgi:alginate O-acetyltransferase complex protein AlgI